MQQCDVRLQTNDPLHVLDLRGLIFDPAGPAIVGRLVFSCGGYSADLAFWWHASNAAGFAREICAMDELLEGDAYIGAGVDQGGIRLGVTHTGAVDVCATLGHPANAYLSASFRTDQTCLRPLAADVERMLDVLLPRAMATRFKAQRKTAGSAEP